MSSLPRSARLDHVDAMRAVAVILVMWTHYAELYAYLAGSQFALDTMQRSIDFGRIGVVIFFGISGMLIPHSLRGSPLGGARRFLIRRVCRLYPAFWLSLPIGYAAYWTLFGNRLPVADLLANLTMVPTALGHDAVMPHYWTLETELVFYVLCLALHLLGGLHRTRDLCLICLSLCVAFVIASAWKLIPAAAPGQYKGMPYHLAIMFWGACFRQAYDAPSVRVRFGLAGAAVSMSNRAAFSIVTLAVVGIAVLMGAVDLYRQDLAHVAASLGYVFGIVAFLLLATVLRIRARSFAWLGEISYSVYLLHGVPLYLIYGFCKAYGLTGGPLALYMALTVPPALALSWASHRLVETAGIHVGHRLTDGGARGPGRPARTAATATSAAMTGSGTARPAPIGGDDA